MIAALLNRVTMYRLVLYYLGAIFAIAAFFGLIGWLPYDPASLLFSLAILTATCWATNTLFARVFIAATNVESAYITALILALIITPVASTNVAGIGFLIFAAVWAMASKYIFAIGKRHIFNPAAFAVALTALTINQSATWWVAGNLPLAPFVLLGGLLVVRKIQRFDLVGAYIATALAATLLLAPGGHWQTALTQTITHSAIFFFAFVMLTEPLTTPPTRGLRVAYGALVGLLFAPNVQIAGFFFTPELALLAGNVFSYLVSPKGRFMLTLKSVEQEARGTYDFVFSPDRPIAFAPGQYVEWTLPHRYPDNRGNRRYFTIASAPTEPEVRLGVRFYPKASSFKRALAELMPGGSISVSHVAGGFTLPRDPRRKLVFIAGGIGITPFRSMIQYLLDRRERRDIVLLYANKNAADVAYKPVFDRAERELGLRTLYALSDEKTPVPGMWNGMLDAARITATIPDYRERTFYLSGPHAMVESFTESLRAAGVSRLKIKTDFFPGFV